MTSDAKALQLAEAIQSIQEDKKYNRQAYFAGYDFQNKFIAETVDNNQILLMCANRVGKTYTGTYTLSRWATGDYPDWWCGHVFTKAPLLWALGHSNETMRDILQPELFGQLRGGEFDGTGWVPKERIAGYTPSMFPNLAKEVFIHNDFGGLSKVQFKAYSQGQRALMGAAPDAILIDEEPIDPLIYPQCVIRLLTTKGKLILTFTPENGMTELVTHYLEDLAPGQALINATWDDAPHLSTEDKQQILDALPAYQRKMRSQGIPVLGEGMVYPIAEEAITCDPFVLPQHFKVLAAIDFGIAHPTAVCSAAYDPDKDTIYITKGYKVAGEIPAIHAASINSQNPGYPIVYPHDGDNDRGTGESYCDMYRASGVDMAHKFHNEDQTNFVEPGLMWIYERMRTGRFKVFNNVDEFFPEFRRYHRKNGKIVKTFDDFMDAVRYAAIMVPRYGVQVSQLSQAQHIEQLYPTLDF